jgi:hypothetical protein
MQHGRTYQKEGSSPGYRKHSVITKTTDISGMVGRSANNTNVTIEEEQ